MEIHSFARGSGSGLEREEVAILVKEGKLEIVEERVKRERERGGRVPLESLKLLVEALGGEGEVERAENVMREGSTRGQKCDVGIYNVMLQMYGREGEREKAFRVFEAMEGVGVRGDETTFRSLILMFCEDSKMETVENLLKKMEMRQMSQDSEIQVAIIRGYGNMGRWEEAKDFFNKLKEKGEILSEKIYFEILEVFQKNSKPEEETFVISQIKLLGINLIRNSQIRTENPKKDETLSLSLEKREIKADIFQYTSLIDVYLKEKKYDLGLQQLSLIKKSNLKMNSVTWTCLVGGASRCTEKKNCLKILKATSDAGFDLPWRIFVLSENEAWRDLENLIPHLYPLDQRAQALINVFLDLFWNFGQRKKAEKLLKIAISNGVYPHYSARVEEREWSADFRGMSVGATLTALHLWLLRVQDASLSGALQHRPGVSLRIGGCRNNNSLSLKKTIFYYLREMGAPFRISKNTNSTKNSGVFLGPGHTVFRWIKDSPQCWDLELRDEKLITEKSLTVLYGNALVSQKVSKVLEELEKHGMEKVSIKVFSRLCRISDEKRQKYIEAFLGTAEGREERRERRERRDKLAKGNEGGRYGRRRGR